MQQEAYENYGARGATIIDPFGHRWMLSGPVTGAPIQIQHGDVGYVSVWTPDADRAAAFYGHVLGWNYDPQTHQVTNTKEHIGLYSVDGPPTLFCCYAVADLAGARQAIVDGGGTVDELEQFDFGTAERRNRFAGSVVRRLPAQPGRAASRAQRRLGQANFHTSHIEVPDSTAFRAFYSRVLFWTFEPGRIDDGWQVQQTHPMAGVAGGNAEPVTVPMWTVEDVDAAVSRVREAGGTVIDEPSQQAYGKSALCTDDQGSRFYLGEF